MTNRKARLARIEGRVSPDDDLEITITNTVVDRGHDGELVELSQETRTVRIPANMLPPQHRRKA